jgi:hypothetical protein
MGHRRRHLLRKQGHRATGVDDTVKTEATDWWRAAKKFLYRVQKKLDKGFFVECQNKTLGKVIFQTTFWCAKRIQIKKFSTTKFHNFS